MWVSWLMISWWMHISLSLLEMPVCLPDHPSLSLSGKTKQNKTALQKMWEKQFQNYMFLFFAIYMYLQTREMIIYGILNNTCKYQFFIAFHCTLLNTDAQVNFSMLLYFFTLCGKNGHKGHLWTGAFYVYLLLLKISSTWKPCCCLEVWMPLSSCPSHRWVCARIRVNIPYIKVTYA